MVDTGRSKQRILDLDAGAGARFEVCSKICVGVIMRDEGATRSKQHAVEVWSNQGPAI